MKVVVKVGKSTREVDLQHLLDAASEVAQDSNSTEVKREAVEQEVAALFAEAVAEEWLRITKEIKDLGDVRKWLLS